MASVSPARTAWSSVLRFFSFAASTDAKSRCAGRQHRLRRDRRSCSVSLPAIARLTFAISQQGAIVLFCAPGTVCTDNTIIARERNLLGAINMCVRSCLPRLACAHTRPEQGRRLSLRPRLYRDEGHREQDQDRGSVHSGCDCVRTDELEPVGTAPHAGACTLAHRTVQDELIRADVYARRTTAATSCTT